MSVPHTIVLAHGGEALPIRDLPLPLGLTLVACAAVVAASAVVVAVRHAGGDRPERLLLGPVFATRALSVARAIGFALIVIFGFAAVARLTSGVETIGLSLIPLAFWVGLVVSGVLLASIVATERTERSEGHEGATKTSIVATERTERSEGHEGATKTSIVDAGRELPPGEAGEDKGVRRLLALCLGPVLVYALFWFELVSGVGFAEKWVFGVILAYGAWMLVVLSPIGRRWRLVDPLSVLFRLATRAAPLRLNADGMFYKGPIRDLAGDRPMPVALCVAVFVVLGATTLDNARTTNAWESAESQLRLDSVPDWLVDSGALLLAAGLFFLTFRGAVVAARRWIGRDLTNSYLLRRLSWSLIPIAIAYLLAHNLTLLITGFPLMLAQLLDPLALGWDPFGLRHVLLSLVPSAGVIWFPQIALVLGGHILGVVAVHRGVVRLGASREQLVWSLLPLTLLMTAYTVATLFLLAQPLT